MAWKFWGKQEGVSLPTHKFACLVDFRSRVFEQNFAAGQKYVLSVSSQLEREAFAVLEAEGKIRRL